MKWSFDRIGCDVVCCYTLGRENVIFLQYDYNINDIRLFSNYIITERFLYNNRQYKRDKPGNRSKYYRLLDTIPYNTILDIFRKSEALPWY